MSDSTKAVKKQFANNAEKYVSSEVHAKGDSLALLIQAVNPRPDWIVLDVATGGGHNALAFANFSSMVIAGDITHRILEVARKHIHARSSASVNYLQFDAEALPFANDTIDCVTSRIAPHHFPNIRQFITEAARILKRGGVLAIADNVSPNNEKSADYLNAYERLRDPSHHWAYSLHNWRRMFEEIGLTEIRSEIVTKDLYFLDWSQRSNSTTSTVVRLKAMLEQAPADIGRLLNPREQGGRLKFSLTEAVIVVRKPID